MRARVAYISSLGTTAILVAAALLMLALVGALVAFRGWPGSANGAVVQPVPLGPGTGAARTVLIRPVAATRPVVRVRSFAALAVTRARVSTAGLVKRPGPAVVQGLVMDPAPAATMSPATPQSRGGSSPPDVQPAVAPPPAPSPGDPSPVSPPSNPLPGSPLPGSPLPGNPLPDNALPGVPLLDPGAAGAPQAPSSDQLVAMVGELIGSPPPPPVSAGLGSLNRR
jgi:hypothetical protein